MNEKKRSVGLIGTGNFGRLLYVLFNETDGFEIKMASHESPVDDEIVFEFEEVVNCDVVIPAVPIWATQEVLKKASEVLERTDSLFVSVCSVMAEPANWMEEALSDKVEMVASHPIFGPISTSNGTNFAGKKWVYSELTGGSNLFNEIKKRTEEKGLEYIQMTPTTHDELIARSQAVAFLVGRLGVDLGLCAGEFDTDGFKALLLNQSVIESQSGELIRDIFRYNGEARKMMKQVRGLIDKYIEESEN